MFVSNSNQYPTSSRLVKPRSGSTLDSYSTSQKYACCGGFLVNREINCALRLPCKRWDCEYCCRKKGRRLCRLLKESGAQERMNRLITLPFKIHKGRSWREALQSSGLILNRFFTLMRQRFGKFGYFWTREIGRKSWMVHFHILTDRYFPWRSVRKCWVSAGGGSVVHLARVKKATGYVLKYITKAAQYPAVVQRALYKKRRYTCSRALIARRVQQKLPGEWRHVAAEVFLSGFDWETKDGVVYAKVLTEPPSFYRFAVWTA